MSKRGNEGISGNSSKFDKSSVTRISQRGSYAKMRSHERLSGGADARSKSSVNANKSTADSSPKVTPVVSETSRVVPETEEEIESSIVEEKSLEDKKVNEMIDYVIHNLQEAGKALSSLGENFEHDLKLMLVDVMGKVQNWVSLAEIRLDSAKNDLDSLRRELLSRSNELTSRDREIAELRTKLTECELSKVAYEKALGENIQKSGETVDTPSNMNFVSSRQPMTTSPASRHSVDMAPDPGGQSHAQFGSQSGGPSVAQFHAQTGGHYQAPSGAQSGALSGVQSGAQSDDHSGSQFGAQSSGHSGAQSGAQFGAQSGAQFSAQSGAHSGAQFGSQSGAQFGAQSGAQSGGHSGAQSGPQFGAQSGPQFGAQTAAQSSGHSGAQYSAQHGPQSGVQSGGHSGPQFGGHSSAQYAAQYGAQSGVRSQEPLSDHDGSSVGRVGTAMGATVEKSYGAVRPNREEIAYGQSHQTAGTPVAGNIRHPSTVDVAVQSGKSKERAKRSSDLESELSRLRKENERIIKERTDYENAIQRALLRGVSSLNAETLRVLKCPPVGCYTPCCPRPSPINIVETMIPCVPKKTRDNWTPRGCRTTTNAIQSRQGSIRVRSNVASLSAQQENNCCGAKRPSTGTYGCFTRNKKSPATSDRSMVFLLHQSGASGVCVSGGNAMTQNRPCARTKSKKLESSICAKKLG